MPKMIRFTKEDIRRQLDEKGYAICPNVLTKDEINERTQEFKKWQASITNHDTFHNQCNPHGIYKFHQAGHQRHAWKIRANPIVQSYFKYLWGNDDIIVSYDGSCYLSKDTKKKDNIWTHTDQAPRMSDLQCYQGLVSLTSNKERTLVVYEGSHKLHASYFKDRGIDHANNWNLIEKEYLAEISDRKKVLSIPAGSLVLWDSRTFHQNQYGTPDSEERIVQYVCYLPRNHPKNTLAVQKKRELYFKDKRTTSHWPCPVKVNGLQPQTYGDTSKTIDYSSLTSPQLEDFMGEIKKLI